MDGPPVIALRLVPKVLKAITHIWAPKAFIISFKLETDNSILEKKSRDALAKYKHQVRKNFIVTVLPERRQICFFFHVNVQFDRNVISFVLGGHR